MKLKPRRNPFEYGRELTANELVDRREELDQLTRLVIETHPSRVVSYHDVTGGLDRMGMPVNGCFGAYIAGDHGPSQISSAVMDRLRQLAQMLFRDKSQPADVRSTAGCVVS